MITMIDKETRKKIKINENDTADRFLSGKFEFVRGHKIDVINPDGISGKIPVENIQQALGRGYQIESTEQINDRALQKKYGEGKGAKVKATAEGALRGLTFGVSDKVLQDLFDVEKEALRERKERLKGYAIGGEVAGTILPILFSGGTGAVAKGAALAPSAAIAKIGTRSGKLIAQNIVKEGIKKKVLPKIAAGGVEGSLYGIQHLNSEAALGNADYNAANIISYAGSGALFAGGVAGTLGMTTQAGQKALTPIVKKSSEIINKKLSGDFFKKKAGEKAFDSLRALKKFEPTKKIKSTRADFGQTMLDEGLLEEVTKLELNPNEMPKILDRAQKSLQLWNDNLRNIVSRADDFALKNPTTAPLPTTGEFSSKSYKIANDMIAPGNTLKEKNAGKWLKNELDSVLEPFNKDQPITVINQRKVRRKIDSLTRFDSETTNEKILLAEKARNLLEDSVENTMDDIVGKAGLDDDAYRVAKRKVHHLLKVSIAAEDTVKRENANLRFGLTSTAVGAGALGHTGSFLKAFATAVGHRYLKRNLSAQMALKYHKISKMDFLNQVKNTVENKVSSKIANYLSDKVSKAVAPTSVEILFNTSLSKVKRKEKARNRLEAFKERSKEILDLINDPKATAKKLSLITSPISDDVPNISMELQNNLVNIIRFAYDKMPKDQSLTSPISGESKWQPSDSQLSKWTRYLSALNNPMSVIDDLEKGELSQEGVETLREIYPSKYEHLVSEIIDQITEKGEEITYRKKLELSVLFGIPLMDVALPQFVQMSQTTFQAQDFAPPPGRESTRARAKGLDNINVSGRAGNELSRISSEGIGG